MFEKLKSFLLHDTYFFTVLLLLIGIGSFGLGRLSVGEMGVAAKSIPSVSTLSPLLLAEPTLSTGTESSVPVVASKSGTKYHLFDCPGAKQMKAENRIEFRNVAAARAAGYSAAANCPGL